jgi:O-antigen/teichoic acid export membrane protein
VTNKSLKDEAVQGSGWTTFSAIVGITVQLGQFSILGRLLGPENFGQMTLMMVVIGLANSLADFGMGNYIIQCEKITKKLFFDIFTCCTFSSSILIIFIYLVSQPFAKYYHSPELVAPLTTLSIAIIMNAVGQISSAILQRYFKFKIISIIEIVSIITGLLVSTYFAINGYGIWVLVIGQICVSGLKCFFAVLTAIPLVVALPSGGHQSIWQPIRFGFYQTNERIFNFLSVNLDKLIIGKYLGEHVLGLYSVAFQIMVRPIMVINPIFSRVLYPIFSRIRNDNIRLARGYLEVIQISAVLLFPIYIVMFTSSYWVIHILLGEKWTGATSLLSILSLLGLSYSLGGPLGNLILAKGRADLALFINIASFLLNMLACLIGSQYGIQYVAMLMFFASAILLLPIDIWLRKKLLNMSFKVYFDAIKWLLISAFSPILIFSLVFHFLGVDLVGSFLSGAFSVLIFLIFVLIFHNALVKSAVKLIRR